jgi:mannose/cellobiose epimerase-like protein (N-acyl-D-glucosamine 2-epimerase family)
LNLTLATNLLQDAVEFWLRHGIDNKHGGWYTNLDK